MRYKGGSEYKESDPREIYYDNKFLIEDRLSLGATISFFTISGKKVKGILNSKKIRNLIINEEYPMGKDAYVKTNCYINIDDNVYFYNCSKELPKSYKSNEDKSSVDLTRKIEIVNE
jgi:hypothetical protein